MVSLPVRAHSSRYGKLIRRVSQGVKGEMKMIKAARGNLGGFHFGRGSDSTSEGSALSFLHKSAFGGVDVSSGQVV